MNFDYIGYSVAKAQLEIIQGAPVPAVLNVGDFMEQPHAPSILYPHHHHAPVAQAQYPQFPGPYVRYL
jgi:hypothetical protein